MLSSGEHSTGVVHKYQGPPPGVRRTRPLKPHYYAEIFNYLFMLYAINCKCLASKINKKWSWLAHYLKNLAVPAVSERFKVQLYVPIEKHT